MPSDPPADLDTDEFDAGFHQADEPKKPKAKPPPKSNGASPGTGLGDTWLSACQIDGRAEPRNSAYNAILALENDPAWVGAIGIDEMRRVPVLRTTGVPLEDGDICDIHVWMLEHGLEKMGIENVREAVTVVARKHRFHPVRELLDRFADDYDGVPRITDFMSRYFGTDDDEYHRLVGVMFLVGMAARIYQPGCKLDTMLVLEGPQGTLKSQAIGALAGEYFSDTMPDLTRDPVRVSMHLRGKWLIEVSELSAFSRAEAAHLKAFLSTAEEKFTPKYGRIDVAEPRQCLFVGTTNKHAYLHDETGARRFWPIKCGVIDLPALRRDRQQLLAEAVLAYRDGKPWWPDDKLQASFFAPVQAARFDGSAWEKAIDDWDWSVPVPGGRTELQPPFYLADIALGALHIETGRLTKADEQRLATALDTAGWSRADKTRKGRPWFPP